MTLNQVTEWLRSIKRDRHWLAEQLGVSKRTVDNWYSKEEIPLIAQKLLDRVMQEQTVARTKFTQAEFDLIQKAMKLGGYSDMQDFIAQSAIRMAEDVAKYRTGNAETDKRDQ